MATGQHHTSRTHKVVRGESQLGDTRATTGIPSPLGVPKQHKGWFGSMVVAVVSVVATVMTAGIIGALAGVESSIGMGLLELGAKVLVQGLSGTS